MIYAKSWLANRKWSRKSEFPCQWCEFEVLRHYPTLKACAKYYQWLVIEWWLIQFRLSLSNSEFKIDHM